MRKFFLWLTLCAVTVGIPFMCLYLIYGTTPGPDNDVPDPVALLFVGYATVMGTATALWVTDR